MSSQYVHLWDIDSETTYLNHGSFGPSPIQVRAAREEWSARLERQPMRFFCAEMEEFLEAAAVELAQFLKTKPSRVVFLDNATFAMNMVAASVKLDEGDEIVLTDHEYGAVRNIWQEKCRQTGARIVSAELPFPVNDDGVIDAVQQVINDKTKMIVVSHVTSATAAVLPVKRICELANSRGILAAIDGPHAVAMLDLDLDDLGCDFYCASGHKWLCAPFGSGFLWADSKHHATMRFPIVSWGGSIAGRPASWKDRVSWLGSRDPAAVLSIPAAIEFLQQIGLQTFRDHAHGLICQARRSLLEVEGCGPLCTASEEDVVSMCAIELPQPDDWKPGYHGHPDPLQLELRDEHGIETPVASWNGHRFLRMSAHLYNSADQFEKLVAAVKGAKHLS